MVVRFVQRISFAAALSVAAWSIPTSSACGQSCAPPPPGACPAPAPSMQGREPSRAETATPSTTAGTGMSDQPQVQAPDLSAQSGIAAGEGYVPVNMIGNLLRADRSLSFRYINTVAAANISVSNSKVSEDNSPVPSDRVYFRYNHFSNAESVSGLSLAQILAQGSFAARG